MTEEEAKTKWCPFARIVWAQRKETGDGKWVTNGTVAFNRAQIEFSGEVHLKGFCIASACMAWRWGYHRDRTNGQPVDGLLDIARGESDADVVAVGYCGLAGDR